MDGFIRTISNAFDDLGHNDDNMRRDREYNGQPHTCQGVRGYTEIKGITFRDLRDAYIRAIFHCANQQFPHLAEEADKGEHGLIAESYLYEIDWESIGPMAVQQNLSCEIEKLMGIYPNVPENTGENDE